MRCSGDYYRGGILLELSKEIDTYINDIHYVRKRHVRCGVN